MNERVVCLSGPYHGMSLVKAQLKERPEAFAYGFCPSHPGYAVWAHQPCTHTDQDLAQHPSLRGTQNA